MAVSCGAKNIEKTKGILFFYSVEQGKHKRFSQKQKFVI